MSSNCEFSASSDPCVRFKPRLGQGFAALEGAAFWPVYFQGSILSSHHVQPCAMLETNKSATGIPEAWSGNGRPPSYPSLHFPLYLFFYVLAFASCAVRPSIYRKLLLILYGVLGLFYIYNVRSADTVQNQSRAGIVATNFFVLLDFLVLTDAQKVLRRKGQSGSISDKNFWERFKWSFSLVTSLRGVGWSHEPTDVLPKYRTIPRTRLQFVFQSIATLLWDLALYIVADVVMQLDPGFLKDGPPFTHPGRAWYLRPMVLAHGLAARAIIDAVYTIAGIVYVLSGLSQPLDWPPFFASFSEAWSVQRFWGRVWHQMMRRVSRLFAISCHTTKSALPVPHDDRDHGHRLPQPA